MAGKLFLFDVLRIPGVYYSGKRHGKERVRELEESESRHRIGADLWYRRMRFQGGYLRSELEGKR